MRYLPNLLLLFLLLFAVSSHAATGDVVAEQKISDTAGAFTGTLGDGDLFGTGVASLGDFNGDEVGDLVVGAGRDDNGGTDRGSVWVLLLDSDGTVLSADEIPNPDAGDFDLFGHDVEGIGDLNGDGYLDVVAGARLDDDGGTDRGAIWILFLDSDGSLGSSQKISDTQGGFGGALADYDRFGGSVANMGDLDGDGNVDLAVGAIGDDTDGNLVGAVWILFLDTDGTVKSEQKITGGSFGVLPFDLFGERVANAGDVDGDGRADLAVGAAGDTGSDTGAIYILFLKPKAGGVIEVKGSAKIADGVGGFTGVLDASDLLGFSIDGVGDLDDDGVPDLVASAYGDDDGSTPPAANRGAVWVLLLNSNGTVKSYSKISDTSGSLTATLDDDDNFGFGLTYLGDLDGDLDPEIAVGAPGDDDGGTPPGADRGAVHILSLEALPNSCGNGFAGLGEECDDGDAQDYDGCSTTCESEEAIFLLGTADGGSVDVTVDATPVSVPTTLGQSDDTVLANLAAAIEANVSGVTAFVGHKAVIVNASVDDVTVNDTGLLVPAWVENTLVLADSRVRLHTAGPTLEALPRAAYEDVGVAVPGGGFNAFLPGYFTATGTTGTGASLLSYSLSGFHLGCDFAGPTACTPQIGVIQGALDVVVLANPCPVRLAPAGTTGTFVQTQPTTTRFGACGTVNALGPFTTRSATASGSVSTLSLSGLDARRLDGVGQLNVVAPLVVAPVGSGEIALVAEIELQFAPEPAAGALLAAGAAVLAVLGWRRRR